MLLLLLPTTPFIMCLLQGKEYALNCLKTWLRAPHGSDSAVTGRDPHKVLLSLSNRGLLATVSQAYMRWFSLPHSRRLALTSHRPAEPFFTAWAVRALEHWSHGGLSEMFYLGQEQGQKKT